MIGVINIKCVILIGEKHEKSCGGKYIKIAEPEGYIDKNKKQDKKMIKNENNSTIETFFTKIDTKK